MIKSICRMCFASSVLGSGMYFKTSEVLRNSYFHFHSASLSIYTLSWQSAFILRSVAKDLGRFAAVCSSVGSIASRHFKSLLPFP